MEAELKSGLRQYADGLGEVLINLPQPIVIIEPNMQIGFVNTNACKAFGFQPEDLLNSNFQKFIGPDDLECLSRIVAELSADGEKTTKVTGFRVLNKDRIWLPVSATLAKIQTANGESHIFIRLDDASLNISLKQHAKLQMKAAANDQEILSALDILEDPIIVLDNEWRYLFVNGAGWEVLGRDKSEIIGHNVWELMPHLKGTEYKKAAHKAVKTGRRMRIEEYYPGSGFWYETTFYPSNGGLVAQMKNITEAKKVMSMNDQLMETLEQAMGSISSRQQTLR